MDNTLPRALGINCPNANCPVKKADIRYIRKTILDPEKGLIVRINKNTDFRYDKEKKIKHYEGKLVEFEGVLTWKKTISRGLWGVYSILLGILIKLLFFGN